MNSKIFLSGLALCAFTSVSAGMEIKECMSCYSSLVEKSEQFINTHVELTENQKHWCKSQGLEKLKETSKIAERSCSTGYFHRSLHAYSARVSIVKLAETVERRSTSE